MSPEETQILAATGSELLRKIAVASADLLFWGIHATLSIAALVSIGGRGLNERRSQIVFATLACIFALNTLATALDFAIVVQYIQGRFTRHLDLPLVQRVGIYALSARGPMYRVYLYLAGVSGLIVLFGDIIVLWRAWTILVGRKKFLWIPTFLVFVSLALSLTTNTFTISSRSGIVGNDTIVAIIGITAVACSLASNLITTTMIGVQAFQHRKVMTAVSAASTSRAWRIMLFLTEAGVIYLIVQVLDITLNLADTVPGSALDYFSRVWFTFSRNVSASYFAVVILIVSYNRSLANDSGISGSISNISTSMGFVRPTTNGTVSHGSRVVSGYLGSSKFGEGAAFDQTSSNGGSKDDIAAPMDKEKSVAMV